jgi:hypothetical protein
LIRGRIRRWAAWASSAIIALVLVTGCERAPEATAIAFVGATGSAQPRVTQGPDGGLVLSWLEPAGRERVLKFSRYDAGAFGAPTEVARSEQMFVNWADFPSVTPITESLWFAHWLERREGSAAYDIATVTSRDGGVSWTASEQMNEDDAVAEHGFVSVFSWDEQISAFWLDGRELANWSFDNPDALLGTSLRLARYGPDGAAMSREIVDDMVCDCCQPDVAMTREGPIVAYRDRTAEEIRDVVVRRWLDGGWAPPLNLGKEGWFIEGCPVNGPALAARGADVAAVWFTAAENRPRVRFARSADAGSSFPVVVDVDTNGAYGQPGIVLDDDGRAVLSWWRRAEAGGIELMARAYDRDGSPGREIVVARESVGQPIDVPQLAAFDGAYLVAWTTFDADGSVRLARLDL